MDNTTSLFGLYEFLEYNILEYIENKKHIQETEKKNCFVFSSNSVDYSDNDAIPAKIVLIILS